MKPLIFSFLIILCFTVEAQMPTPQSSPKSKLVQQVGLTEVTIEYSRPSARGRKIFGELAPFASHWRTGANQNTLLSFSDDVLISGKPLHAGTYALYSMPEKESWTLYFYEDTTNWGLPSPWDEEKIALSQKASVIKISHVESFAISLEELSLTSAFLRLSWENTAVQLPIEFPTAIQMEAEIDKMLAGEPSANDLYSAAVYYLGQKKDLMKAKDWITRAVEMRSDAFWFYRQKSLIHEALDEMQFAIESAKISMRLAQKSGNDRYVELNKKQLAAWKVKSESAKRQIE